MEVTPAEYAVLPGEQLIQRLGARLVAEGVQGGVQPLLPQLPAQLHRLGHRQAHGFQLLHPLEHLPGGAGLILGLLPVAATGVPILLYPACILLFGAVLVLSFTGRARRAWEEYRQGNAPEL